MKSEELKALHMWPPVSESYSLWAVATRDRLGGLYYALEDDKELWFMTWAEKSMEMLLTERGSVAPPVEAHVLDRRAFNAVVGKYGENYHIGILQGLVSTSVLVATKLTTDLPPANEDHLNIMQYARWIILFVFMHEVTHIRNGHVDFKTEKGRGASMAEAVGPVDNDWSVISQTLEYDADAGAFNFTIREALGLTQGRSGTGQVYTPHLPVEKMLGEAQVLGRAIASYFLITEGEDPIPDNVWERSHPPAVVRCTAILALMVTILSLTEGLSEDEISQCESACLKGFVEAEILFGEGRNMFLGAVEMEGSEEFGIKAIGLWFDDPGQFVPKMNMLKQTLSDEVDAHLEKLRACWSAIRPELMRHKKGPHNLAP